jgi:hypothetical protein
MPKEVIADGRNGTQIIIKMSDGQGYKTTSRSCEVSQDGFRKDGYTTYKVSFYVDGDWEKLYE